ncbi:DUF3313 domain-containing protein [Atopomonas sediminilitoris]|uniref:DUF3313 domain-containing protein n=1 Tax=Atopomonas sediminilitoris TaxID=2919919 RepID=UPI001F4E79D9|nr:DUF3313 domain-containing protein [Atopomonas sediminilitoris]MCJ8169514.1 DUF3313 domain-containing protein [Atopomonas sediminilitoris]
MMHKSIGVLVASLSLALAGCASKTTAPEQYSGFLGDYSQLQKQETPSGAPVMRWKADGFDVNNYASILIEPVCFHPKPAPSDQVSDQALEQICSYTQQRLTEELAKVRPIVQQATNDTLVLRGALTAVQTSAEELQPYEVVPVALVAAAAMSATGNRDQQVALFFEAEVLDGGSSKPLVRAVRKAFGENLKNDSTQLTLNDVKGVIDQVAKDARLALQ